MDVATQLRHCRERARMSQKALADAAGTSQPTVAAYESGRVTPSVPTLLRLLKACGFTIKITPNTDTPRWTRVEEKSLAVHQRIAAQLLKDPERTILKARSNLDQLRKADRGHSARWLDEWDDLLDRPTDEIVTAMLARTQDAIDLRQMTPFAGVITDAERSEALQSVNRTDAA